MRLEQDKIDTIIEANNKLRAKMTKKNEQYIFNLTKALAETDLSEDRKVSILNTTMSALIDGQKAGYTARHLFGTVTEYTATILNDVEKKIDTNGKDWMYIIDGGLLMVAMMCLVSATSGFFNRNAEGTEMGLLSLIVVFLFGGFGILLITKNMPGRTGKKKNGIIRYLLVSTAVILIWILMMGLVIAVIPEKFNPTFTAPIYAVLGISAFGAKIYLKKRWNLQNTFM